MVKQQSIITMLLLSYTEASICGSGSANTINWWYKDSTGNTITEFDLGYGYPGATIYFGWDGDYESETSCSLRFSYLSSTAYELSDSIQLNPDDPDSDTVDTDGATSSASIVFLVNSASIPDG